MKKKGKNVVLHHQIEKTPPQFFYTTSNYKYHINCYDYHRAALAVLKEKEKRMDKNLIESLTDAYLVAFGRAMKLTDDMNKATIAAVGTLTVIKEDIVKENAIKNMAKNTIGVWIKSGEKEK